MYRASFTVMPEREGAKYDDLLRTFVRGLTADLHARDVMVERNSITFTGAPWPWMSWEHSPLLLISTGRIELDPTASRVAYSLSFAKLMLMGALMIGLLSIFMVCTGAPAMAFYIAIPVWWLWGVGMSYLIILARIDRFMKRCIRSAGFCVVRGKAQRD